MWPVKLPFPPQTSGFSEVHPGRDSTRAAASPWASIHLPNLPCSPCCSPCSEMLLFADCAPDWVRPWEAQADLREGGGEVEGFFPLLPCSSLPGSIPPWVPVTPCPHLPFQPWRLRQLPAAFSSMGTSLSHDHSLSMSVS